MSNRNTCKIWLAALLALLFTAVPVLLMETRGFTYETNDDFVISGIISRGEGWCPYVSKLLTGALQRMDSGGNLWTGFNIIAIAAGTAFMIYTLCRSSEIWWLSCLIALSFSVFGIFFRQINYTRSAVCLFAGGAALLLFAVFGEDGKMAERAVCYVLGVAALVTAALIREASAFMGLGFLAVFTAVMLAVTAKRLDTEEWKELLKKGLMMFAAAALCLGAVGASRLAYTDAEREYNRFNRARTAVVDYSFNYPEYAAEKDEYDARGISETDKYLMENWNYSDTELITAEKYEAMAELKRPADFSLRKFASTVAALAAQGSFTLPLLLVLVLFFAKDSDFSVIPTAAGAAALLVLYLGLYLSGRMIERVTQPAFYTAALLAVLCTLIIRNGGEESGKKPSVILLTAAVAALLASILCCPFPERIIPDIGKQNLEKRFYSYLSEQDGKIFAIFTDLSESYVIDPRADMDIDSYDNVIQMGGWNIRTPEWYDKIHALGIENPYRALFERDDVYASYDRISHRFLCGHYGDISASEVFTLPHELSGKNTRFVRYMKHREAGEALEGYVDSFSEPEAEFSYGRRWVVSGRVKSEPGTVCCNIRCGEKELSFLVTVDDRNRFTGCFYDIPEDFSFKNAEFVFFR